MWHSLWQELLTVQHADPDVRRRGRLLLLACLIVFGFLALAALLLLFVQRQVAAALIIGGVLILQVAATVLTRRGLVLAGAGLVLLLLLLGPPVVILARGSLAVTPFFFAFAVLVAGLALRPWQIWPVTALALALLATVALMVPPSADSSLRPNVVVGAALLVVVTGLFAFLSAGVNRAAIGEEAIAHAEADAARDALRAANAALEAQVAARTAELRLALEAAGERAEAQERLLTELAAQRAVIREMSVPVLPVSAGTLVMPLVGALDGARLSDVQQQALASVEQARARRLIVDVTGVPVLDTQVARGLMETTRAVALLGAEVVLVGVRPEVAQTMVSLGVELAGLRSVSTLEAALER